MLQEDSFEASEQEEWDQSYCFTWSYGSRRAWVLLLETSRGRTKGGDGGEEPTGEAELEGTEANSRCPS